MTAVKDAHASQRETGSPYQLKSKAGREGGEGCGEDGGGLDQ
jgi:hypothetical protein